MFAATSPNLPIPYRKTIHGFPTPAKAMSILTTIQGLQWAILAHNGRAAYGFYHHAIHFEPVTGLYHLKQKGETIFVSKHSSACLEEAHEVVLDYYADQIVPSWES